MRFILFNIAVGAALIYLFNGGELSLNQLKIGLQQAKAQVAQLGEPKPTPKPAAAQQLAKEGKGHGHDVIRDPKPKPQAPAPTSKSKPKPKTKSKEPTPTVPQLEKPASIANHPTPKLVPGANASIKVPPVPPAVAKRRAQVLAKGKPVPVALKAGTSMMLASERRRELDALAEEMEMLYIEKVGG